MLTRILPRAWRAPSSFTWGIAALAFLALPVTLGSARAQPDPIGRSGGSDLIEITNCVGSYRGFSCSTRWGEAVNPYVRSVPGFTNPRDEAEAAQRDRVWLAQCRPVIRQDRYGVRRYQYAVPGCEFGRVRD